MDWDDFKYVQAVAQTGSVRRAGERLNVHGSTVARHLDHLERQVGTRLFTRTPRGMEITASGAQVIELLDRVAAELDQVERSLKLRGPVLAGPVSLAIPADLAGDLVIPLLGELYRQHPDLELALPVGQALEILQRGDADLALWMTDDPPGDLIGRPLATVMACAYAAPGHLPALEGAADAGRWVGSADPDSLSARIRGRHFPDLALGLRLDDVMLRAAALEAGLGIGLLPCHVGDASPRLARAGAMEPVRLGELWLFTRPDGRGVARIQAVSGFLQDLFSRHRHRLEGIVQPQGEAP
jgi:DNA-binding transcriptional LysR family regulator